MRIAMITAPDMDGNDPLTELDSQIPPLATALADRGHQPIVYTPADQSDADAAGEARASAEIAALAVGEVRDPRMLARYGEALTEAWRSDPPDVVHAFGTHAGLAVVAAPAAGETVPHVQDTRALTAASATGPVDDNGHQPQVETALARRADEVLAASRHHADDLAARGVPRSHLAVVPYGIDLDADCLELAVPERSQPTAEAPYRLVCAGGCADPGLTDLIQALPQIPGAELVITGAPHDEAATVTAAADRVLALARQCGIAERVRLLDRDDTDRAVLLGSADLVVSGPDWTATALACLQAMARGIPLIATSPDHSDDSAELVVDGVTGALAPQHQPRRLAATIRGLLADPVRRTAYGIAGADRAAARFGWGRVAIDAEAAYTSATRRGRFTGTSVAGAYEPRRTVNGRESARSRSATG